MELLAKGIGSLRGRTRNHLPVYGDIKIETINDSERVAILMQDYPTIVVSESKERFNLVTEIAKRLNLEIIPDENYKSAQKLLQALAITAEPKEDENYPFTKHFLDFYAIDLGSGKYKYTPCPINGELQFEAFDNFGRRHSIFYSLAGVTIDNLLFAEGKSISNQTWGNLTVMLIGQRDSNYEGIWNLTGNSKIGLSNTNGVASFEWSEAIKTQKN